MLLLMKTTAAVLRKMEQPIPYADSRPLEIEELDLRIVRDRKEFRRYVNTVRHSEEFTDLENAVSIINEQIQARMMAS